MRKTNYQQIRRQRDATRKARQDERIARRTGRVEKPADGGLATPPLAEPTKQS